MLQRYHSPLILDFIIKVFPCAKFIINYREDIDQQVTSSIKNKMIIKNKESLTELTKSLINYAQSKMTLSKQYSHQQSPQFYFAPLESFTNLTMWNQMFHFLDRPKCLATGVLRVNDDGYSTGSGTAGAAQPVGGTQQKVVLCS